jgi:hypothetical protein
VQEVEKLVETNSFNKQSSRQEPCSGFELCSQSIFPATTQMSLPDCQRLTQSHKHRIIAKDASQHEGHESCHQCDSN